MGYIQKATELNPNHTFDYPWNLGLAYYTMGQYTEATKALENALERNDNAIMARLYLTASYVEVDRLYDAKWEIAQVRVKHPNFSLSDFASMLPLERPEQLDPVLRDLRKAGLSD